MKPYMEPKEIKLLEKYYNESNKYLEFGSGGSTYLAVQKNIDMITSIETDKNWIKKLMNEKIINEKVKKKKLIIKYVDIGCNWCDYISWNLKQKKSNDILHKKWEKYAKIVEEVNYQPDLILVDGRFRVASTLKSIYIMNENTKLLIHDYTHRKQYHVVEEFLEPIECINTLQVFRLKKEINLDRLNEVYQKFKYIID